MRVIGKGLKFPSKLYSTPNNNLETLQYKRQLQVEGISQGSTRFLIPDLLCSLSLSTSLLLSPLIIGLCRTRSTRLTAVLGAITTSLAWLFSSFATELHQLFLSHGLLMGIGVGMMRDASDVMVGQYFKKRRARLDIIVNAAIGLGIALITIIQQQLLRKYGWRLGLTAYSGLTTLCLVCGIFYRSASLYHPQRRAILHLKSQRRRVKDKNIRNNLDLDLQKPSKIVDLSPIRSRTIKIVLMAATLAAMGIFQPLLNIEPFSRSASLSSQLSSLYPHYTSLGLGWALGSVIVGIITGVDSKDCRASKLYVCQSILLIIGIIQIMSPHQYTRILSFVSGLATGGFVYALRMLVLEKTRAKNFAVAMALVRVALGIGLTLRLFINRFLRDTWNEASSHISGASLLLSSLILILITVHRRKLRCERRRQRRLLSSKSESTLVDLFSNNNNNNNSHNVSHVGLATPTPTPVPESASSQCDDLLLLSFLAMPCELISLEQLLELGQLQKAINKRLLTTPEVFSLMSKEEEEEGEIMVAETENALPMCFADLITSCDKVEHCISDNDILDDPQLEANDGDNEGNYEDNYGNNGALRRPRRPTLRMTLGVGGVRQNSFVMAAKNHVDMAVFNEEEIDK